MFIVVGGMIDESVVRVACAGPSEALAELETQLQRGIEHIRVFDLQGFTFSVRQLEEMINVLDGQPISGSDAAVLEKALLRETVWGADSDVDLDLEAFTLQDLTQIAAILRPGACLTIRGSKKLSPLERGGIEAARPGQVRFL